MVVVVLSLETFAAEADLHLEDTLSRIEDSIGDVAKDPRLFSLRGTSTLEDGQPTSVDVVEFSALTVTGWVTCRATSVLPDSRFAEAARSAADVEDTESL